MNQKKLNILGNVAFWFTLFTINISICLIICIGHINGDRYERIIKYSFINWCFIPIVVICLLIGKKLKKNNQKYKKNYIISFIMLPILIVLGSLRFVITDFTYDVNRINVIQNKVKVSLPTKINVTTRKYDSYNISYVSINDKECKKKFTQEVFDNLL